MLITIKENFSSAILFGFTGTPIQEENQRKINTTATVFGNELHRYSIADGIRDKNVLGFDPYRISTFKDSILREQVALLKAQANTVADALKNKKKKEIYYRFLDNSQIKMAGYYDSSHKYIKGIEDYIPIEQYQTSAHQQKVVEDIVTNWMTLSHGNKFHAIFATSKINEAIAYYRLLKKTAPNLNITALFDPNIDNNEGFIFKEEGLVEIIQDYNACYEQSFSLASHARFKKDIANRLAHKEQYKLIERKPDLQLDLLIVVDQMLTGFDSKWVNTLYLDKLLRYENIIQAFSRTNRLFGYEKPFGTIRYYRKPHTMQRNIDAAIKLYSGDKPLGLFVDNLERNLTQMNYFHNEIVRVFELSGVSDFESLPKETETCGQFAKLFKRFNEHLEAAKIQGFIWQQLTYQFNHDNGSQSSVTLTLTEQVYLILALRYKELFAAGERGGGMGDVPFDIEGHLTEIDTGKIDSDYMNATFNKYLKKLQDGESAKALEEALNELHKTFATLTQEEQKFANIFLHDVQRGDINLEEGKTLRDHITEYQFKAKNEQISTLVKTFELDEVKLKKLMSSRIDEHNINEYGRFDELKATADKDKIKRYFETLDGQFIPSFKANIRFDHLLRKFIINGGIDLS